jgi:hypothetical protein
MNKFIKRLQKIVGPFENAVVIGQGKSVIEIIVPIFKNVFVYDDVPIEYRAKNIVFREGFKYVDISESITACFVDRKKLDQIKSVSATVNRYRPCIFIEGIDRLIRPDNIPLFDFGYLYHDTWMNYHYWKQK